MVAESAHAVEEEDGVGFDLGALGWGHLLVDELG